MLGEEGDVVEPLAKGRHRHLEHVEPEQEVGAEAAVLDHVVEVPVGRGDHAHVHADGVAPADAAHLALLEDAEELRLHGGRHVAHLVDEQGAAIGALEEPVALLDRPREGAALVPEELRLEEAVREGRAVLADEGAAAPRRELVDGSRRELLPRSGLAPDEHREVARGGLVEAREDALHALARAEEPEARRLAGTRERDVGDLRLRQGDRGNGRRHCVEPSLCGLPPEHSAFQTMPKATSGYPKSSSA